MSTSAPSWRLWSPAVLNYGIAVVSAAVAVAIDLAFRELWGVDPSVSLFLCTVMLVAWASGPGPALATTTLTILAFDYFFLQPIYSFALELKEIPRLVLFAVAALLVVLLSQAQRRATASLRRARDEQQETVRKLQELNETLRVENAERGQAEERARQAQEELQLTIDTIPVLAARYRSDGFMEFRNRNWRHYTGLSKDNVEGERWGAALHPDDLHMVEREWRAHIATGEPFDTEQRLRRADGEYRWHWIQRVPLRDENGNVVKWYGVAFDIDDRKRVENALRQSEADLAAARHELQLIIDTVPVLVLRHRADGIIDFVNQVGRSYSGIISRSWTKRTSVITHPDDVSRLETAWDVALATGEPFETEQRLRRADGEYRWFFSRRVPLRNSDGEVIAWYGAALDIEDRKRAEDALRQSEADLAKARQELQLTIDTISTMVVVLDHDGKAYFANRSAQEYIGKEFSVENVRDLIHPDDRDRIDRLWRAHLVTGEPFQTEQRMLRADGQYRWNYMTRVPLRDETGRVVKWYGSGYDIEDRKRAENALRASEAQLAEARRELELTIDSIPVMVSTFDADGTRSFVNKTWQDYTGHAQQEATGRGLNTSVYYHPEDVETFEEAWRTAQAKGEMMSVDVRTRRADGVYRWYTMRRAPQRDEKGKIVKWYSVGLDVEDQKVAENALRRGEAQLAEAERELRLMIDSIPVMVTTYQPDGTRIFVNQAWQRFTGLSQEEACGGDLMIPVHPDHHELGDSMWQASLASGEPFVQEKRLRRADGQYRWHWVRRVPLRDETGKVVKWYGAGFDVEDQKQAESALKRSEAQLASAERELRLTLDSIPTLAWRARADGYAEYINKRWLDYTGLSLEQALGWEWQAAIHPDDRAGLRDAWLKMLASGKPDEVEARMRRFDGAYRWFLFRTETLLDDAGSVVGWYGTNIDIEDRKQVESALQRIQAYAAEAQKLSQTGSFAWEVATRDYFWSDQTYQILGFDRSVKPSISLVVQRTHPEDRFIMERELDRSAQRAPYHDFKVRLLMPDGQIKHIHLLAHRITYQSGNEEIVGAVMDITAARKSQEALDATQAALAHASRVATLGEVSATIAHEVNQPLAAIVANAQACLRFLRRETPDLNDVRGAVEWIVKDGNRAGEIIRRVRGLLKKVDTEKLPFNVNDIIHEVVALLQRELNEKNVTLQLELAPSMPLTIADRVQLQQVIINLIMNGAEAMQKITERPHLLVVGSYEDETDQVVVAVKDCGAGIPAEIADRLFDAFFSTKPSGLGIGLSICRSIIQDHGGQLWATENSEGPGATFRFALPAHRDSAPLSPAAPNWIR